MADWPEGVPRLHRAEGEIRRAAGVGQVWAVAVLTSSGVASKPPKVAVVLAFLVDGAASPAGSSEVLRFFSFFSFFDFLAAFFAILAALASAFSWSATWRARGGGGLE